MKTIGIIPARGGSKGVLKKNIKLLNNKPLIAYTIEAALESKLDLVIVSTDDSEIATVSEKYGATVPFLRPEHLASDSAKSLPVMQHALAFMEEKLGKTFDAVMMLQPTTPHRTFEDINDSIDLLEATNADSVISVVDVEGHHPARMKFIEEGKLIDPPYCEAYENQPRQELAPMYIRNGAIYLTKREALLADSFKGKDCRALVMPDSRSVNIDSVLDFQLAEFLTQNQVNESA
jgi:CMP-N,N'-diacetyllegionaminic acid synthase